MPLGRQGARRARRNTTLSKHRVAGAKLTVFEASTLPYLTLPYLTLPYLTLPYLALPYLTLPYLTLPYLTLEGANAAAIRCSSMGVDVFANVIGTSARAAPRLAGCSLAACFAPLRSLPLGVRAGGRDA